MVDSESSTDTYTTTATTETSGKKKSSLLSPIEESDSVERNAPKMVSVKFMVYVSIQIIYFPTTNHVPLLALLAGRGRV